MATVSAFEIAFRLGFLLALCALLWVTCVCILVVARDDIRSFWTANRRLWRFAKRGLRTTFGRKVARQERHDEMVAEIERLEWELERLERRYD